MRFSVIIPAYQSSGFIGDALASALDQSHPPHEVIVVDDGSTDRLDTALAPYADRLILVRQPNRGPGAARNAGVHRATGDWIVLLDADDYWDPTRLARIATHSRSRPAHQLITTDALVVGAGGATSGRYYERVRFAERRQRDEILRDNFVFSSAAAPRDLILRLGGFDESPLAVDDWDMWIRIILSGAQAGLVPDALAYYRQHGANTSNNMLLMARGELRTLDRALARNDLSAGERSVATRRRRIPSRFVLRHDFDRALADGRAIRRVALRVVVARRIGAISRIKAAGAVLSPRFARRVLR